MNFIKAARPFLLVTLFLFCLVFGFIVSSNFYTAILPASQTVVSPTPISAIRQPQMNLVVVHADNLNAPQPALISVWAVFITQTDSPSLVYKSLYPQASSGLANQFSFTSSGELSPTFLKALETFQFPISAYVLLDDQSISPLLKWLTNEEHALTPAVGAVSDQAALTLAEEKDLLEDVCGKLSLPAAQRGPQPAWKSQIPDHLRTSLSFEDAAVYWDRVTLADPPSFCKAFVTP